MLLLKQTIPIIQYLKLQFFIEKIAQQAEEIGILKQTIMQLKQESVGRVSGAESSTLAGAG